MVIVNIIILPYCHKGSYIVNTGNVIVMSVKYMIMQVGLQDQQVLSKQFTFNWQLNVLCQAMVNINVIILLYAIKEVVS